MSRPLRDEASIAALIKAQASFEDQVYLRGNVEGFNKMSAPAVARVLVVFKYYKRIFTVLRR